MATSNAVRIDERFNDTAKVRGSIQNTVKQKDVANDNRRRAANNNGSVVNAARSTHLVNTATERFKNAQSMQARVRNAKEGDGNDRGGTVRMRKQGYGPTTAPKGNTHLHEQSDTEISAKAHALRVAIPMILLHSFTGFCCWWKFICGIFAVIFIFAGAYTLPFGVTLDQVAEFAGSTAGKAALDAVNLIFGTNYEIPTITFTSIGLVFWSITLLFVLIGYGGAGLMLKLRGSDPLKTVESTMMTYTCLAADVLPFLQIFPWMMFWAASVSLRKD